MSRQSRAGPAGLLETAVPGGSLRPLPSAVNFFHTHFSADRLPNEVALNAVRNLIQCGVDTDGIVGTYTLIGHRQATSTACPGNALFDEITNWPHWTASP